MHVTITERRRPPDRPDVVERLNNLGLLDASAAPEDQEASVLAGFALIVDGVEFPVLAEAYEVVAGERGPAVTVTFAATSLAVGEPRQEPEERESAPSQDVASAIRDQIERQYGGDVQAALAKPRAGAAGRAVWGSSDRPDPREAIPGWKERHGG